MNENLIKANKLSVKCWQNYLINDCLSLEAAATNFQVFRNRKESLSTTKTKQASQVSLF